MLLIKSILMMLTGCGCFLVGINLMSKGFLRVCEDPESRMLKLFRPKNRVQGVINGTAYTVLVQSSSSTSVFAIKLLNVGAITLYEAATIIMGANIGTTVTAFIVSLSALSISTYLSFLVFVGGILFLSNNRKCRIAGEVISGFGLVFVGLDVLGSYAQDEQIREAIINIFSVTDSALLLIIFGAIVTAIFQSSSVTTSIIVFMVAESLMPLREAIYLVMGANVGACITSLFASSGGNLNTKRAAFINVFFNLCGVVIFLIFLIIFESQILNFINGLNIGGGLKLALFHLMFNLGTTIILLPFVRLIVGLSKKTIAAYHY